MDVLRIILIAILSCSTSFCAPPIILTTCPFEPLISPCTCDQFEYMIECHSSQTAAFRDLFSRPFQLRSSSSRRRTVYKMKTFAITSRDKQYMVPLHQLTNKMFAGYKYDYIVISETPLRRIHWNSFPDSLNSTMVLDFFRNKLTYKADYGRSDRRISHGVQRRIPDNSSSSSADSAGDATSGRESLEMEGNPEEYDLFAFLRQFKQVLTINLRANEIEHIPDWAFSSLTRLQNIYLNDNHIRTIGQYPFFPVPNLHYVCLSDNFLSHIPSETLRFTNSSDVIQIDMVRNQLDDQSFPALNNTNRPIILDVSRNRMTGIPRHAFEILFAKHNSSQVKMHENNIICGCGVRWLLEQRDIYSYNVRDIKCNTGLPLFNRPIQSLGPC